MGVARLPAPAVLAHAGQIVPGLPAQQLAGPGRVGPAGGHIAGAVNIPLTHLAERIGELPAGRPVVVHCEGGYRSAIAASLLQKLGRRDVHDMVGGYKAWLTAKPPA